MTEGNRIHLCRTFRPVHGRQLLVEGQIHGPSYQPSSWYAWPSLLAVVHVSNHHATLGTGRLTPFRLAVLREGSAYSEYGSEREYR